ncbi:hypothetical protein SAMN02745220_00261 [Desulfopila aestuarii DSM 18488]|uniref:Uncharacterized protein n=1 Tax=Desulfopila aestuarii DSM 18488 TaxID=1121416 RepID=A0A1M7XWB4_9BACT|nr:hypothetical protein SAMN02745220_00261 [Desulfopila aestuarii DSM 18488]
MLFAKSPIFSVYNSACWSVENPDYGDNGDHRHKNKGNPVTDSGVFMMLMMMIVGHTFSLHVDQKIEYSTKRKLLSCYTTIKALYAASAGFAIRP